MSQARKVVTRYAPSPTGPQHIGGVRTALYSYLFARQTYGTFILRIEDTDQSRFVPGAEEFIVEALKWLGIEFDEGVGVGGAHAPYRQSERTALYQKHAQTLLDQGHAYIAFDTPEEIDEMKKGLEASGVVGPTYNFATRMGMKNSLTLSPDEVQAKMAAGEPYVLRFKVPKKEEIRFHDEIRGWVVIHSSHVDDKVLLKSDGLPTYHLANVVDDHEMGVTHVIRGEEWLSSTPLHVLLYRAFGWEGTMPTFAHLPLFVNPDGSKMSKRNADKFGIPIYPMDWTDPESKETYKGYRGLGYLPEALLNYIALLGWNPGTEQEILSREELVEGFSLEKVHKAPAKFDMEKLKHFQQVYLRSKSTQDLLPMVKEALSEKGIPGKSDEFVSKMIDLMRERVTFVQDFAENGPYFFHSPKVYDDQAVQGKWTATAGPAILSLIPILKGLSEWNGPAIEATSKAHFESLGLKVGQLMMPLRLAVTGMSTGPGTFDIAGLLGKEETLLRLEAGVLAMNAQKGIQ